MDVEIHDKIDACRDRKDNFILEMAVNSQADCIVTGDQDLLVLDPFREIRIFNFTDFKKTDFEIKWLFLMIEGLLLEKTLQNRESCANSIVLNLPERIHDIYSSCSSYCPFRRRNIH
jgi:hypothetical protein